MLENDSFYILAMICYTSKKNKMKFTMRFLLPIYRGCDIDYEFYCLFRAKAHDILCQIFQYVT